MKKGKNYEERGYDIPYRRSARVSRNCKVNMDLKESVKMLNSVPSVP